LKVDATFEAGGSVAGMKIEVVFADHLQKPDVGATIVRRWFDQENVDTVVDVPHSSVALAINQIARANNKVLLPSSSQSLELTAAQCSPNTVRWTIDTWATSHSLPSALMKGGGGKTWFFAHADNAYGRDLTRNATEAVTTLGGKVVGTVAHPLGITDFSSFVVQAKSSNAEVVGLANYSADLTNFLTGERVWAAEGRQRIAAFVLDINNVRAVGPS
jgi:branched-chain amino acid transport system substrate-binding protein